MGKIRIGIDPGKGSFLCLWNEDKESFSFHQFPVIGKETDLHGIAKIFSELPESNDIHAVIEHVHSVFNSSAGATFEFGWINGVIESFLVSRKIPYTKVQPKAWQKDMWQGIALQQKKSSTGKTMVNDTKAMSEMAAKRLFPEIDLRATERSKKADHNKVDALLICEYCKRKF